MKAGLTGGEDVDESLDRHVELRVPRIVGGEGLAQHLAGPVDEGSGRRVRREDEEVAGEQPAAALVVGQLGIEMESGHP